MTEEKNRFIVRDICSSHGGERSGKVYFVIDTLKDKTEVVIEQTVTERHPVTKYHEIIKLHNDLNGTGFVMSMKKFIEFVRSGGIKHD